MPPRHATNATNATIEAARRIAAKALAAAPAGLFTDIDGTLAPIVADPGAVALAAGARAGLEALADRIATVVLVTGRSAADARRLVGTDRVAVAGNHGIEWLAAGAAADAAQRPPNDLSDALRRILAAVPQLPGTTVEHKGYSATVHYRNAPEPEAAGRALWAAVEAARAATPAGNREPPITMRRGRMSIELRPASLGNKGDAVRTAAARHGLRGIVVLGDDLTDLDMFRAARALREASGARTAAIAVGSRDEVPPEVFAEADASGPDPAGVVALLETLARR